jgi:hypothetical protein
MEDQGQLQGIQLSQAHLQALSYCPRKFQYIFLDQLAMPQLPEVSERQQLGTQFHQLMQQQALGLDIQPFLQANPQLQQWFTLYQQNPPPMLSGTQSSEVILMLPLAGFVLIGVYDLLIETKTELQIIDWKTYQQVPKRKVLQQQWQTKLYPFLLSEARQYAPEQISMTYWFTEQNKAKKSWMTFPYSAKMHNEIWTELESLLSSFQGWLDSYQSQQTHFPQVDIQLNHCFSEKTQCSFIHHCQRNQPDTTWIQFTDIDAIAEIPL